MSEHLTDETTNSTHNGSLRSYVIGFVLSLIFTIIPYLAVTRELVSGNILLLTILAFAVIQMFVQIFFFLHLGRGPKPLYNVVFFFATAGLIVLVIGASLLIMDSLYRNMSPTEVTTRLAQEENIAEIGGQSTGACQGNKANHVVIIKDGRVKPFHTDAKRCDTLTFTIEDATDRQFVFGTHEKQESYGGLYEVTVSKSRSKIITLNETGDFSFHDHVDHDVVGHFTVEP